MNDLALLYTLAIATTLDIFVGDPPNRFHPVAWMGNAIAIARRWSPKQGHLNQFLYGSVFLVLGVATVAAIGWAIDRVCDRLPIVVAVIVQALVLKSAFSIGALARAARAVAIPLGNNDLAAARHQVAYHLVSRDVSALDAADLSAATIESVAENTSDSVVAPILYFAIFGLPGVLVYRFVNTCDAMLGYRTPQLEWLGKSSARLDDLLNLLPARITAVVTLMVGCTLGERAFFESYRIWRRDHRLTSSPNAGHPMSAAAGVLGVALEKKGHYVLGDGQRLPDVHDISRAIRLLWGTALTSIVCIGITAWMVTRWLGGAS